VPCRGDPPRVALSSRGHHVFVARDALFLKRIAREGGALSSSWTATSDRVPCPRRGQLLLIACDALFLKRIARGGDWLIRFLPFPN
jgi:hypothetical protein